MPIPILSFQSNNTAQVSRSTGYCIFAATSLISVLRLSKENVYLHVPVGASWVELIGFFFLFLGSKWVLHLKQNNFVLSIGEMSGTNSEVAFSLFLKLTTQVAAYNVTMG